MDNQNNDAGLSPLIHVICHNIEESGASSADTTTPQDSTLLLMEKDPAGAPRILRFPISDECRSEMQVAFHYGVRENKVLPSFVDNIAAHAGEHLRRVILSLDEDGYIQGEVLVLSHLTGVTKTVEVDAEQAIIYAMAHGLPIFAREELLKQTSNERSNFVAEMNTILEGKALLRRIIESGQLPDEFKPEETLVAIANLRRHEIIELIELAEELEYYEWAYYLSAFVDLDELSPGGMDV